VRKLTPKRKRFVDEYLVDLNATRAAIRAGYSRKTAAVIATKMLRFPNVAAAIKHRIGAREQRTEITQDRVLKELARIAFFDIRKLYDEDGSLKRPTDLSDEAAAVLAGVDVVEMADGAKSHVPMYTKKAKVFDKTTALTLAMRHLGMLTDKTELTGKDGTPLVGGAFVLPGVLTPEEWERAAKAQQGALTCAT